MAKRYRANPRKDRRYFKKSSKDKKLINATLLFRGGTRL